MDQRRLLLSVEGRHQGYGRRGEHGGESDLSLLRDDPVFLLFDLIWVRMPEEVVYEALTHEKKRAGTHFIIRDIFPSISLCLLFRFST